MRSATLIIVLMVLETLLALGLFMASPWLAPHAERVISKIQRELFPDTIKPEPQKPAPPTLPPFPDKFYEYDRMEMARMWNGMWLRLHVQTSEGDIASREREQKESYLIDLALNIQVPKPNQTLDDLTTVNPHLPTLIPALPSLLETAEVSPFYHKLYELKTDFTRRNLKHYNQLLTRHNFFDCDTILHLRNPETSRKALMIQAEMDVVTDGSDPDRTLEYDNSSPHFQPFTSYSWAKRTQTESPFIARLNTEKTSLETQLNAGASGDTAYRIRRRLSQIKRELPALRYRSSLVATLDPFIVVPTWMIKRSGPYAPSVGDYAVVIHGDTAYPAILGDTGPSTKIGEASLLICQAIDPESHGMRRPVSDLTVTYLIFPGTAEKPFRPPDLEKWHQHCSRYLTELGGSPASLYHWAPPAETDSAPAESPASAQN